MLKLRPKQVGCSVQEDDITIEAGPSFLRNKLESGLQCPAVKLPGEK